MHPGQHTEQEQLQEMYLRLSDKAAQVELEFNRAGVMFFVLIIIDDRSAGEDEDYFKKAFWADVENTFIPRIHRARQLREQARLFLRDNNCPAAINNLDRLDDNLDDLAEDIVALEMRVQHLGAGMTIECSKDSLLFWSSEGDKDTVFANPRFREWVLKLPEIEHALALGTFENADQAVSSMLEIEDCLE